MMKDCNGKKIPVMTEMAILSMLAEKNTKSHTIDQRERRKVRMRNSENYRMFCKHDLDIVGLLLDSLSHPIKRT